MLNNKKHIEINRGVKQGDPLFPLLFRLVLDPLVSNLERKAVYEIGDNNISVLAFMDDIVLKPKPKRCLKPLRHHFKLKPTIKLLASVTLN